MHLLEIHSTAPAATHSRHKRLAPPSISRAVLL